MLLTLVTGEYPPWQGGVADYTRQVARAIAARGVRVEVWAPAHREPLTRDPGVVVRELPSCFGFDALQRMDRWMETEPRRLVVQFAPHALGLRGMNVPLAAWLSAQQAPVDVMFHEVHYPFTFAQPWRRNVLALAQMLMASLVGNAARHAFLSIEGWAPVLARVAPRLTSTSWSPVPSNMPTDVDVRDAFALREQLAGGASVLVGHFSTHTPETATFLASVARLLRPSGGRVVVMGRGWDTDATGPHFVSKGRLPVDDVARHLAACDVIVQPYPLDGVSARRTTVMSSLALGAPIVTNEGRLSESIWRKSSAVHLVKATPEDFAAGVLALASDAELRAGLSARARTLYRSYFDIARTVDALLGPRSQGEPCASWSPAAPASSAHTSARGSSGTETR